jgi:hypothetical protein
MFHAQVNSGAATQRTAPSGRYPFLRLAIRGIQIDGSLQ